jgi:hypothetical protein
VSPVKSPLYWRQRRPPTGNRSVSDDLDAGKFVVDDSLSRRVQVGFDGLERRPAADLHDHARVHIFVDEEALRVPAAQIVTGDVSEVSAR